MRLTALYETNPKRLIQGPVAIGASIPAPIEGWDAVSPIAVMSPKRAVRLINFFPQPGWIEPRRGHIPHADTETVEPVETLMAYQGVAGENLFAASDGSIFDVTTELVTADVTGLANSRFQYINFATTGGNFLQCVNGADVPRYYDGTAWATAAITGIDATAIIGINAHKNRIWYVLAESTEVAYLPVDSIQGAASTFELGGLLTQGGYVMAMGTWSVDAGDGPDDYAVFVSSRGQVIIYKGTDPDTAETWSLIGVFNMGAPIGRRCLYKVGADVAVICVDGVVPLSKVMIFERAAVAKVTLTERIQRVMNDSARDYGDNFGWQLISYPRGTRAILNVPVQENVEQEQYVMNTLSGAWCRFTGKNGSCWERLGDRIFFGGNDGLVYEEDVSGTDAGETVHCDMITAFNYFDTHGRQKRFTMCQPLISTDSKVTPGIAFNVDFRTDAPLSVPDSPAPSGSLWDVALWDVGEWEGEVVTQTDWVSVSGIGQCASVRLAIDVSTPGGVLTSRWGSGLWGINTWGVLNASYPIFQVNGFNLVYEKGAFV